MTYTKEVINYHLKYEDVEIKRVQRLYFLFKEEKGKAVLRQSF